MSLPMIHIKDHLNDFTQNGSWDGLILIIGETLDHLSSDWREFIEAYRIFDKASIQGVHLVSCPLAPESRLVLCSLNNLKEEAYRTFVA